MTVGSHQTPIGKNDERFTPPKLWRPLGLFTTDAATSAVRPWNIGAQRNITIEDDSLSMDWGDFGDTWLNPPFNRYLVGSFVLKMCAHNRGIMLLHQRHDTQWWQPIGDVALLTLEVAGRIIFHKADGSLATIDDPNSKHFGKAANSGAPVTLIAFGMEAADRLASVVKRAEFDGRKLIWPEGGIPGGLRLIRFPRGVLVMALEGGSWREIIHDVLKAKSGPVSVEEVWHALRDHTKAKGRKFAREQIRKVLQLGAGKRVGPDQWIAA